MATYNNGPDVTFIAGEALTKYALVKISAANTVSLTAGTSGNDKATIGVTMEAADSGAPVLIRRLSAATAIVTASGNVSAGNIVYTAAAGAARTTNTSQTSVGIALEDAADGDAFKIACHPETDSVDN